MMSKRVFFLLLAWLAVAMAQAQGLRPSPQLGIPTGSGSQGGGQRQADYIVAVVNSEPITNSEVRNRTVRLEQQITKQGAPLPPRSEMSRRVLEQLISEKAQLQLARESGVKVDDLALDQGELTVARQNQIDLPELHRRLAADGITVSQFREDLRSQIMLSRLREREVEPKVKVTDLEVDQFIREQQGNTDLSSLEINIAQILVAVPESANESQVNALKARAELVLTRARSGEDFAALAREFSDSSDRSNGGQLGLRNAERYPPLFIEAVQNQRAGSIVGPIRSGAGFHILKVIERRQAGMPSVTVTQTHARHILLRLTPQLSESAARERLADFRKRILAGQADFAALAKEYSQDGSAREGGDLGWANPGLFVQEFEDVMNGLAPGQISEPVTTRFGVHLIQVLERRESTLSQREQREIARGLVRERKLDEAYDTWAREVRGRAYVEYREPPQ